MRAVAACVLALAAGAAAPAAAVADDPVRPRDATHPLGTERLSDDRALTRWAHPRRRAPVRRHPWAAAPAFTRLRRLTEDRLPEVYVALRSHVDGEGRVWVKVRLPMRPNGQRGWVLRSALGRLHVVTTRLTVWRATMRAVLRREGRVIWRSRVGVGAPRTPTPSGTFYVRELLRVRDPRGPYGPFAFGTSAYASVSDWPGGGVVGIHGTDAPQLIPGRPSHGCIRVPNRNIRRLARLMPVGTPVQIL